MIYVRDGLTLTPLIYGGTGANSHSDLPPEDMPERLESGTPNTSGIAGLKAGVEFIRREGLGVIRAREAELMARTVAGLEDIAEVTLYGPRDPSLHGGALSFNVAGRDPSEVGFLLDQDHGIAVRVGLHCAPDAHRTIGSFPRGTVRVSPGYFNTVEDIDHFVAAVAAVAAHPAA